MLFEFLGAKRVAMATKIRQMLDVRRIRQSYACGKYLPSTSK